MYNYKARLDRVVDGDTVILDIDLGFDVSTKQRVRLAGIDAPELSADTELEKEAAITSKEMLEKILEGKDIIIDSAKTSFDKWKRYVAYITAGEVNVNEYLLKEGYVKGFKGSRVEWEEEELKKILEKKS